jgi:excisionase family DNA binding protein
LGYFASFIQKHPFGPDSVAELKLIDEVSRDSVMIPGVVLTMIAQILGQMAAGKIVTLIPSNRLLTTQEAAGMLNVSRPYLIKLLEKKEIPHSLVGRHRRIQFDELMKYKDRMRRCSEEAIDSLISEAQELGLGY